MSFEIADFDGMLSECREFAKEKALQTNLPVIEHSLVNPQLSGRDFETPAIYIIQHMFDEMAEGETRCFRRWKCV